MSNAFFWYSIASLYSFFFTYTSASSRKTEAVVSDFIPNLASESSWTYGAMSLCPSTMDSFAMASSYIFFFM